MEEPLEIILSLINRNSDAIGFLKGLLIGIQLSNNL